MFCYKCAVFREHKMPGLNTFTNEKLLFTVIHSVVALLLMSLMYKRYNSCRILKTYSKNMIKIFLTYLNYICTVKLLLCCW